jgi:hypothetical protein
VDASWKVKHVKAIPPKRSVIAQELESAVVLPVDDADVFSFSEYSGVQSGPALPLESAAACLPKDFNRSHRAVFKQSVTKVTWNEDTTLPDNILRRHDGLLPPPPTFLPPHRACAVRTENPRTPRPIVITFRPKKDAAYQCRYRFEVRQGEGFDVVFSGKGTYEEGTRPNPPPHVGPEMYRGF